MIVAPSSLTPGKRDKTYRRGALIDAASAVFAEHGFDAATTREIAERAGCAEGLIHRYFAGKRGLLLAILESKAEHITAGLQAALPDRETLVDELEQLVLWFWQALWERRDYVRVFTSRATIDPEVGHTFSRGINNAQVKFIAEKLRRHQEAGRVRPDADVEGAAYALSGLGFAIGFMFQSCFGEDREQARTILLTAADTFARGLAPTTTTE